MKMNLQLTILNPHDADDSKVWDKLFEDNGGYPSWIYSSSILRYYSITNQLDVQLLVWRENGKPLIAIPHLNAKEDSNSTSMLSEHQGLPLPVIFTDDAHRRRKILSLAYRLLAEHCKNREEIYLSTYDADDTIRSQERWKFLDYTSKYYINRLIVLDLRKSVEELEQGLHKYARKNIKRVFRNPRLTVNYFDASSKSEEVKSAFVIAKELHYEAAKRKTRSDESWESSEDIVMSSRGTLGLLKLDGQAIGFLLVFHDGYKYSAGASLAINSKFKDLNPRSRLEWGMILHLRSCGFEFYEVGQRYVVSHPLRHFSEKEVKMTEFKERLGGAMIPRCHFWLNTNYILSAADS